MLKSLSINNYALIEQLEFCPTKGFVVITGETGAGKSIIMGALGLILGNRADIKTLKDPEKKCTIEGTFDITGLGMNEVFQNEQLDYDDICIIRREITPAGKSRSFINDTPVTLIQLRSVTEQLIDVHSQHQNLLIKDKYFNLNLLDLWAENKDLLAVFQQHHHTQKQAEKELIEKQAEMIEKQKNKDYISFQFNQLDEAKLENEEQDLLENELRELEHAEEIKSVLTTMEQHLITEDIGIQSKTRECKTLIKKIADFNPKYELLSERINSCYIELQDISSEIEHKNESLIFDSNRLNSINERLDLIYSLQKKHHVDTIEELIGLKNSFEKQLEEIDDSDSLLEELQKAYLIHQSKTLDYAKKLSEIRAKCIPSLENEIIRLLQQLGMPNVKLKISMLSNTELNKYGMDEVQMFFSANQGSPMNKMEDIASGGEIARILLSIKAILAKKKNLSSIIFDEIDTGVSGEMAHKMASIMAEMSTNMQVICITHLPQIGAKGKSHFKVYKKVLGSITQTDIKILSPEERVEEIASMLSGEVLTPASLENARDLLN